MKINDTSTFPSRAICGVALGGITGGLTMMAIIHLPGFLISGSWQEGLANTIGSILAGMVISPWGWIGVLAGGLVAWRALRATVAGDATPATSARNTSAGETLLGVGLGLMLLSIVIFLSVMFWMLALVTFPVALILLSLGLIGIRRSGLTGLAIVKGLSELTVAFAAILIAGLGGTFASCSLLQPTMNSGVGGLWWVIAGLSWLVAILLVRRGFAHWTDFSSRRKLLWCAAVTCFPVAAFLLHFTLASIGLLPLSA